MNKICRFTVPASRDLEAILDYLAEYSGLDGAEVFLKKVNETCQRLRNFPGWGASEMS